MTTNYLLAAVPRPERIRLSQHLETVRLPRGHVLFETGTNPAHVYFPHRGTMISLMIPLRDGSLAQAVTIGAEGAAGLAVDATDDAVAAFARGVVQIGGSASRITRPALATAAAASSVLRTILARYMEAALSMAFQSVACNALHPVRARLARWLLAGVDRTAPGPDPRHPVLPFTQDFVATMLCVRRATVNEALLAFQSEGLVRLHRGGLTVLDRRGLQRASCECHAAIRARFGALLRNPLDGAAGRTAAP